MFEKLKIKRDYKKINKLFDYFIENEFDHYREKIDLDGLYSIDVFIEVFTQRIIENKISMNNTLAILSSFLTYDDDEMKTNIIRSTLEKVYDNDNFIKNYCDNFYRFPIALELSELNFNALIPIFLKIINSDINKLSVEILSWVIHNINMEVVLEKQYTNQLIDIMNEKIEKLTNISNDESIFGDEFNLNYYCGFIQLSKHISNDKTIELLKNIYINKMPHTIKLRIINSMIANEISISENVLEKMFEDKRDGYSTFILLEELRAKKIIPKNISLTQEDIATFRMDDWLKFYSGWECEPSELKIIDHIDKDNHRYYIFSFKDLNAENKEKVMVGVSQGYEIGKLESGVGGEDYSQFAEIEDNYLKQAKDLLNELEDYEK